MTADAYRITKKKYVETAFDGEGAKANGGRWNSPGTSIVYVSSSISLATLELLVHIREINVIRGLYCVIPIRFPRDSIATLDPNDLPPRWNAPQPPIETQLMGDAWIVTGDSAVLEVPSAVTPSESNYLLNPAHRDFGRIEIMSPIDFIPDDRL